MDQYASPIDKSTFIREILLVLPNTTTVLATYGIHCGACVFNASETLGEGLNRHAICNEDADDLINDLNLLYQELPARPSKISITKEAALLLKRITSESGTVPHCTMIVDEHQQLTLEIQPECPNHHIFFHPDVPEVRISVPSFLLAHVGGAEISVKNGALTIDLPTKEKCCQEKQSCTCNKTGEGAHHGGEGEGPPFSLPIGGREKGVSYIRVPATPLPRKNPKQNVSQNY